ncbi:MAG: DUF1641 domain-containing protein [Deltaproteobacteria bacterium]|nr:DUF1641 domain-containing protein [Deltaproteobacteria bacterium]
MAWYKPLLLHPILNRFNLLFVGAWAVSCWTTDSPLPFWVGFGLESAYIATRLALEYSGRPLFQLRFLKKDARERYFRLIDRVQQIRRDFNNVGTLQTLLQGQLAQVDRMLAVFLELLILRSRIDAYIKDIRENYDQKIAEIKSKLPAAEGEIRGILEQNLSIYEQRRAKYFEVMDKRAVIEGRLDTIENTLNLLGDYAMGMASPAAAQDQLDLLVTNIQDAEKFVTDVKAAVPMSGSLRMRVRA